MALPAKSPSMLSMISAMVSDTDASSPRGSTARSAPPSIRRMQNNPSPKPQVAPPQIPEEATTATWSSSSASSDLDSANEYDLYEDHNGIVKDFASEDRESYLSDDFAEPCTAEYFHVKPLKIVSVSRDRERRTSVAVVSPVDIGKPQDYVIRIEPPSDTPMPQIQEGHREYSIQNATISQADRGSGFLRDSSSSPPASPNRRASQDHSAGTPVFVPDLVPQNQEQSLAPPSHHESHQQHAPPQTNGSPEAEAASPPDAPLQPPEHEVSEVKDQSSSELRTPPVSKSKDEKPQQDSPQPTGTPTIAVTSDLKPRTAVPTRSTSPHSAVSSISNIPASFAHKPLKPPGSIPYSSQTDIALQLQSCYASLPVAPAQSANTPVLGNPPGKSVGRRGLSSPRYAAGVPTGGQAQAYQASASGSLGGGKKKTRFAMLSALFRRKRNREKAQKASQPSFAVPSQTSQSRSTTKPQPFKPKQLTLAYPPPGPAPRSSIPKKQRTDRHTTHLQLEMPLVAKGVQNAPPRRRASTKPPQPTPSQQNPPPPAQQPEPGSAYLTTKQIAKEEKESHPRSETANRTTLLSVPSPGPGTAPSPGGEQRPGEYRQFSWATNAEETITIKKTRRSVDENSQAAHASALAARLREEQRFREERAQEQEGEDEGQQEEEEWQDERQKEERQEERRKEERWQEEQQQREQQQRAEQAYQQTYHHHQQSINGPAQGEGQQFPQRRQQPSVQQDGHGAATTPPQQAQQCGQYSVNEYDNPSAGQSLRFQQQQPDQHMQPSNHAQSSQKPRSVSGPTYLASTKGAVTKRHVSSPVCEPQYDAPPIPAAYNYVSGAYVSGREQVQTPVFSPRPDPAARLNPLNGGRQCFPTQLPAQSAMPSCGQIHCDASAVSVVSPISHSLNSPMASTQLDPGFQPQQLSPISEVNQNDRSWLFDIPEGATEQEIVRTRQRQYIEAQFASHQQLHAERATQSSSSRAASNPTSHDQVHGGGGFREFLPHTQPQPYATEQPTTVYAQHTRPRQLSPVEARDSANMAVDPLSPTPDPTDMGGPVQPLPAICAPPLPPKLPLIPTSPIFSPSFQLSNACPHQLGPHASLDLRPPSPDTRSRQLSITLLQHPQPASMAASPHLSSANMGAASLRYQLLQQEEQDRLQRLHSCLQTAHLDPQHEERSREASRQRARELERRAVTAAAAAAGAADAAGGYCWTGTPTGFTRLLYPIPFGSSSSSGGGGTCPSFTPTGAVSRTVFELPAHGDGGDDDDELVMRATSYPGQEWVPVVWED